MAIEKLEVRVLGELVGTLSPSQDEPAHVFTYLPNAPLTHFVSLLMPVRAESYIWKKGLHPFFQMNLPEGAQLDLLREKLGPSMPVNDFHLLALTGSSRIGRVEVRPWGSTDTRTNSKHDAAEILAREDSREALIETFYELNVQDMGISGVMPKATLPSTSKLTVATESLILKTGREDTPGIAINEYLCMELARKIGLPVPATKLSNDGNVIAIRRFDRDPDGTPFGLEDFCALLGLEPTNKYDATMERVAAQLKQFCGESSLYSSSTRLVQMLVLNLVIRNADAHSKNYALLYTSKEDVTLAPVFDVVTVSAYPRFAKNPFGLSIGGKRSWNLRKPLEKFCIERLNLPASTVSDSLDSIAVAMQPLLSEIERYASQYQQFRETGKRMMRLWEEGLKMTAEKQIFAMNVDFSASRLSEEKKIKKGPNVLYQSGPIKIM